ncbi:hypothetical protein KUW09_15270 [Mameliella alba]|nr:hypothetical protein [Antarctobacter heliothermus]MBY6145413.1 hypothetical protein [Mameliella alba]MBY6162224.1 hypothetical protein [Mameliella alba]MBY6170693.1 hypothetical protein [Mameliella alba]MBY6175711.1 hypothetical protein [Mameliella alba]
MRSYLLVVAALAVAACEPAVPDSGAGVPDPGTGVGFGNYDDYAARRDAQLNGEAGPIPVAPDVQSGPIDGDEARAAAAARLDNSGVDPVQADPSNPPPQLVANARGISGENDFTAVSRTRDIADDARLIERNRAQYTVVQPEALPKRPGSDAPNIVEYALRTTNPVGTPLYKRSSFNAQARYQRACSAYTSADLAQEDFLALGGPEKDRKGLDPDGDGFACSWNPAPFRAVRGG